MKARFMKFLFPVLLTVALFAVPSVFATEHEASGQATVETVIAKADAVIKQSAETVAAAHEAQAEEVVREAHAVSGGHSAAGEHAVAATGEVAHGAASSEGAHETAEGAGHGGHRPMITAEKLKDLFWRTMNFMALVIILVKFLAKPIAGGLAGRRKSIQEEIEALERKRDEAERSYKEFESRLAGMEAEVDTVVEKAIAMAEDEKVRILKEAEESAADIKRQAEAAVQAAVVEAKRSLQVEVADKAAVMAEELIVKNLTAKDQVAITEQYLEKVGAVQ